MDETKNQLSKKERRALKRREKEESQVLRGRQKRTQGIVRKVLFAGVGVLIIGVIGWMIAKNSPEEGSVTEDPLSMCVQHGGGISMHIHPRIGIVIKGEEQNIPANIGIPSPQCMRPLHTHDTSGTIHLEFPETRDVPLDDFFKIWKKPFSSACIFEFCNGPDGNVKMSVNGEPNEEFENYIMKDQDNIVITYE